MIYDEVIDGVLTAAARPLTLEELYAEGADMVDLVRIAPRTRSAAYNEDQPRVPAGHPDGGQWTDGGSDYMNAIGYADPATPFEDMKHWVEPDTGYDASGERELTELFQEIDDAFTEVQWPDGEPTPQEAKTQLAKRIGAVMEKEFTREELEGLGILLGERFLQIEDKLAPGVTTSRMAEQIASRITHQWAVTAGDHNPLSMLTQAAIMEEFDLADADLTHFTESDPESLFRHRDDHTLADRAFTKLGIGKRFDANDPDNARQRALLMRALRTHVRAQYEETQRVLAAADVDALDLVRGVGLSADEAHSIVRTGEVHLQPASSFTTDFSTAQDFAAYSRRQSHAVIRARIPRKRILSFPRTGFGALNEGEVVVLGGKLTKTRAMVWW